MSKKLFFNGDIITVNDNQPKAEAVLVEDGIIKAVGTNDELLAQADADTEKIDLTGHCMIPGLIDGHSHITFSAMFPRFDAPPIGHIDSIDKLVDEAIAYLKENPVIGDEWLVGMGYDNVAFPDHKHPTVQDMDRISTEVPIVMMHSSGHVGVCNSKVFEVLGITKDTPNPDGGIYRKDPVTGELTGVAEEYALTDCILAKMTMPTPESMAAAVIRSHNMYLEYGVTTAQDGTHDPNTLPLIRNLNKQGLIHVDVCGYAKLDSPGREYMVGRKTATQEYEDGVRVVGVKMFLDGSPQAKTAWLSEPYFQVPKGEADDYRGYPVYPSDDKVCNFFKDCLTNGWQVIAHANGDQAIEQFIVQYERAQKETGIFDDFRPVIIHCQTVREDQLDRMQALGIMPSYFADHVLFYGDYHIDSSLGEERARRISPLASTVKRGMKFTMHQDTPVAPPDMILSIHNAVNRKTASGRDIGPEFAIDAMEALRACTIYGAYQYFEEDVKGSIEVGKIADFAVLDRNFLEVAADTIRDTKVLQTIKNGEVVYVAK